MQTHVYKCNSLIISSSSLVKRKKTRSSSVFEYNFSIFYTSIVYFINLTNLESRESFLSTRPSRDHTQHIETHSLRQRSALTHYDSVSLMASEARGNVCSNIRVTLLITLVFLNVMEVISAHNDGSVHLGALHTSTKDTATDGNVSGEGALLIDVVTLDSLLGCLETETDRFIPSVSALAWDFSALLSDLLVAAN